MRSGRPSRLQPPVAGYEAQLSPPERAILAQTLSCSAIGSLETARQQLQAFVDHTGADELMITSQIFDHQARLRSYEITAGLQG